MLGVGGYGCNALLTAVTTFKAAREATNIGHQAEALMVVYINVICVGCVIVVILWRSLDPAFVLTADADVEEAQEAPVRSASPGFTKTRSMTASPGPFSPSPFDRRASAGLSGLREATIDLRPIPHQS